MSQNTEKATPFHRWYDRHKDEYNQRRRERYHSDPEYREKVLSLARKSDTSTTIPEGFSLIGDAAEQVGRNPYTLKTWEMKGFVPIALKINNCRVYSAQQIALLKELAAFLDQNHYLSKGYSEKLETLKLKLWGAWNGH